jgi:dipeptidyl-peptidase 4
MNFRILKPLVLFIFIVQISFAQRGIKWTSDGNAYTQITQGNIVKIDPKTGASTTLIKKEQLTPPGGKALIPQSYAFSNDNSSLLIFTNTAKVWRYRTKGDYWVLDMDNNRLTQIGKNRPAQTLMFAKFSPDGAKVAYVSEHNLYLEDIASGMVKKLLMVQEN